MKSTILLVVFTMLCQGAVVSVCSTGCTTTSLQTAFDSLAACGDTIQIKSSETQTGNYTLSFRGCAANPITVTSDRASWKRFRCSSDARWQSASCRFCEPPGPPGGL